MQNGDNTSTLYSFYDDQYDFNDLARRVDSGISSYISTLKKGLKYEKEFREAVSNLMAGIKDNTITFGNGRYYDSLGRYSNDKDKDKDVYGWAANYIYRNMLDMPSTKSNTSTKKYDNTLLSKELNNIIFGTDNGNIQYLWDVDPLDSSTNTRGVSGRLSILNKAIPLIDVDAVLKDYSDEDRTKVKSLILQAINAIHDRTVDSGDLLTLSRVFGGIDWNKWLRTDFNEKVLTPLSTANPLTVLSAQNEFYDYISAEHPLYTGSLSSLILNTVNNNKTQEIARSLSSMSNDQLLLVPFDKLHDDSKQIYLNALISRLLLPKSDGVYILPDTEENETVLTYDLKSKKLARKRTHELSYYRRLWIDNYIALNSTPNELLSLYFTEFKKNGGVIKAESGVKFSNNANWYTGVFIPQLNHILLGLKKDSNYYTWLNSMQDRHNEIYRAAGDNWQNTAYKNNLVGNYQNLYKSGYNNEWGDNTIGYNSLGILNAQNQGMFDVSGNTRTSGDWTGEGKNWNTDNLYSAITDYRRLLGREGDYSPELLNYVTNLFKDAGYNFKLDENGYYKLSPISTNTSTTGLESDQVVSDNSKDALVGTGSRVWPTGTESTEDEFTGGGFKDVMLGIIPGLMGAGRLFSSLKTNNKVARTLRDATKPVLKDTYELYSPITGAFSEMLFRNRLAADLRRLASRPFTSDASLLLAGLLEADRLARDLEYLGFLANANEIKRTSNEALARQEDNKKRRTEIANENRSAINNANWLKAQIEAQRLKSNWLSIDNYLKGVEEKFGTNLAERKAARQNASMQAAEMKYKSYIDLLNNKYRLKKPNATQETMLNDPNYVSAVLKLQRRYQYDTYNIGLGRYYKNPYSGIYENDETPTYSSILLNTQFSKNGGKLHPSIITMINKIIKNEDHT